MNKAEFEILHKKLQYSDRAAGVIERLKKINIPCGEGGEGWDIDNGYEMNIPPLLIPVVRDMLIEYHSNRREEILQELHNLCPKVPTD